MMARRKSALRARLRNPQQLRQKIRIRQQQLAQQLRAQEPRRAAREDPIPNPVPDAEQMPDVTDSEQTVAHTFLASNTIPTTPIAVSTPKHDYYNLDDGTQPLSLATSAPSMIATQILYKTGTAAFTCLPSFDGRQNFPWDTLPPNTMCAITFFSKFENIMSDISCPKDQWFSLLPTKLSGIALSSFSNFKSTLPTVTSNAHAYDRLKSLFISNFTPNNFLPTLCQRLAAIKQNQRPLEDFILEFLTLHSHIPIAEQSPESIAAQTIKQYFAAGLNDVHRRLLMEARLAYFSATQVQNTAAFLMHNSDSFSHSAQSLGADSLSLQQEIEILRNWVRARADVGLNTSSVFFSTPSSQVTITNTSQQNSSNHAVHNTRNQSHSQQQRFHNSHSKPLKRLSQGPHSSRVNGSLGSQSQQRLVPRCYHCHREGHRFQYCPQVESIPDTLNRGSDRPPLTNVHTLINNVRRQHGAPAIVFANVAAAGVKATTAPTNLVSSNNLAELITISVDLYGAEGQSTPIHMPNAIVDTGAAMSCVCQSLSSSLQATLNVTDIDICTASGQHIAPVGITQLTVKASDTLVTTSFLVFPDHLLACPILLGNSWGAVAGAVVNMADKRVIFLPQSSTHVNTNSTPSFPSSTLSVPVCLIATHITPESLLYETTSVKQSLDQINPTEKLISSPLNPERAPFGEQTPMSSLSDSAFLELLSSHGVFNKSLLPDQLSRLKTLLVEPLWTTTWPVIKVILCGMTK